MATLRRRELKTGQTVFDIQVYVNGKLKNTSWRQPKNITDKREATRMAQAFANDFEISQRNNQFEFDERTTFSEYADEWLKDCLRNNSPTSYIRNRQIIKDTNRFIGDIPLTKLRPIHIKRVLDYLNDRVITTRTARLKKPLDNVIKDKKIRQISKDSGFSFTTFLFARRNCPIQWQNAKKLAKTLNINVREYFDEIVSTRPYSKSSKEKYKRVINAILNRAVQYELIPSNPAKKYLQKTQSLEQTKKKI